MFDLLNLLSNDCNCEAKWIYYAHVCMIFEAKIHLLVFTVETCSPTVP